VARAESRIRLPADLRRQQIAGAARHVFATHGLAGAKTREIAQAANVTETILYRHFASKQEIFEAAVLQPVEQLATDLTRLTAAFSGIGPEERLERSIEVQGEIRRGVHEITPLLGLALFAQREAGGDFYRERLAPLFDLAADAISRAMAPRQQQIVEPRVLLLALVGGMAAAAPTTPLPIPTPPPAGVEIEQPCPPGQAIGSKGLCTLPCPPGKHLPPSELLCVPAAAPAPPASASLVPQPARAQPSKPRPVRPAVTTPKPPPAPAPPPAPLPTPAPERPPPAAPPAPPPAATPPPPAAPAGQQAAGEMTYCTEDGCETYPIRQRGRPSGWKPSTR